MCTQELCPILITTPSNAIRKTVDEHPNSHHGYILFVCTENEENEILANLRKQLEELKTNSSWNSRGTYLLIITSHHGSSQRMLALRISKMMWEMSRISEVLIFLHYQTIYKDSAAKLYTWTPYTDGNCRDPEEVKLLHNCDSGSVKFRSTKVPNNLMGCPVRVSAINLFSYKISSREINVEKYKGMDNVFVAFARDVMNFSIEFVQNNETGNSRIRGEVFKQVAEGTSDVAIGNLWLTNDRREIVESTVSLYFDRMEWYVPCPTYSYKMKRLLQMFSETVWLNMLFVLITSITVI